MKLKSFQELCIDMKILNPFRRKVAAQVSQVPIQFPIDYLLDANWSGAFFDQAGERSVGIANKDGIYLAVGVVARHVERHLDSGDIYIIFMGRGIKYQGSDPLKAEYTPAGRFSSGSIVYTSRKAFLGRIEEIAQNMRTEGTRVWDGFNQFKATVESDRGPRFLYE